MKSSCGFISCRRQLLVKLARIAAVRPPRGSPTKSEFLRFRTTRFISRSLTCSPGTGKRQQRRALSEQRASQTTALTMPRGMTTTRGVAKPAWLRLRKGRHRDQDAVFCHLAGLLRIEMRARHTPTFCFIIALTRPHLLAAFGDPSQSPACILH